MNVRTQTSNDISLRPKLICDLNLDLHRIDTNQGAKYSGHNSSTFIVQTHRDTHTLRTKMFYLPKLVK